MEDGQGLLAFAEKYNFPAHFYSADELNALEGDFTPSAFVQSVVGVSNVCERSAVRDAKCGRRFKTKLIAMGMCGYDRVIVEPSGIFDVDEFFDILHEEPLNRWYQIGNVIAIVDSKLESDLSDEADFILASEFCLPALTDVALPAG